MLSLWCNGKIQDLNWNRVKGTAAQDQMLMSLGRNHALMCACNYKVMVSNVHLASWAVQCSLVILCPSCFSFPNVYIFQAYISLYSEQNHSLNIRQLCAAWPPTPTELLVLPSCWKHPCPSSCFKTAPFFFWVLRSLWPSISLHSFPVPFFKIQCSLFHLARWNHSCRQLLYCWCRRHLYIILLVFERFGILTTARFLEFLSVMSTAPTSSGFFPLGAPPQVSSVASFLLPVTWVLVGPGFLWVAFSLSTLPGWSYTLLQPEIHDSHLHLSSLLRYETVYPFPFWTFTYGYTRGIWKPVCLKTQRYN